MIMRTKWLLPWLGLGGLLIGLTLSPISANGEVYEVVYPLGRSTIKPLSNSPAILNLSGKTICASGHTFEGDEAIPAIVDLLREQYPNIKLIPNNEIPDDVNTKEEMKKFQELLRKKGCDAVISGVGC